MDHVLSLARRIELLEHLVNSDAWNELLLPNFLDAQTQLLEQAKQENDPYKLARRMGELTGLDAIVQLPKLLGFLQQQAEQEKNDAQTD